MRQMPNNVTPRAETENTIIGWLDGLISTLRLDRRSEKNETQKEICDQGEYVYVSIKGAREERVWVLG